MKKLPIGLSDFKKLIEGNYYFDKSKQETAVTNLQQLSLCLYQNFY